MGGATPYLSSSSSPPRSVPVRFDFFCESYLPPSEHGCGHADRLAAEENLGAADVEDARGRRNDNGSCRDTERNFVLGWLPPSLRNSVFVPSPAGRGVGGGLGR